MREMQIGGSYYCKACGKHCSGAELHHCPEKRKQKQVKDFMEEHQIEVTCPRCKEKRKVPMRHRPFFGDITICSECRKNQEGIFFTK